MTIKSLMDTQLLAYKNDKRDVSFFLSNGIRIIGRVIDFDDIYVLVTSEFPEGMVITRSQVATMSRKSATPIKHQHNQQEGRHVGSSGRRPDSETR